MILIYLLIKSMTLNLSKRALAELISVFPYEIPHLKKILEERLVLLEQEELHFKSVFDDNSKELWEVSKCITLFKEAIETIQDDEFVAIIQNRRNIV